MPNIKRSYKDRLIDFGIAEGEFKNDNSEIVKYKQLVATVEIDGEVEELLLSGTSAQKPKFLELTLKSAKKQSESGGLLDD